MEYKISATQAFNRYSDMVYRLAFARVKNKYDADDILQEVFLRFIKCKDKVENEEHLKEYDALYGNGVGRDPDVYSDTDYDGSGDLWERTPYYKVCIPAIKYRMDFYYNNSLG